MKYLLHTLLFFIGVSYCNAQKFKPALNLTKGNTYYLTTNATSAIVQTMSGQQNTVNLAFNFRMAFKVISIADTVYNMEVSYQSLSMKMDMGGNTLDLDSKKNDPQDVPSSIIAAMMNKPFNLEMTKTGKIKSVQNIDKMVSEAIKSFPQIDSTKKEQVKAQFMQSFGPNAFKGSIEMGTAIFPDIPVAKEDKWTVKTQLESPAKATVTITYQLADIIEGTYLIHGEGSMVTDKNTEPAHINGLPIKYNLNGSLISDIRVDKATGWISEVKLKQAMMGDMQILDNPQVPGGMTIPMTFNTDVNTTGK
ncbi:DUF6263 family protein [Mucilaginibacter sp. OK098]|uniref:DUF6263 family protein n=1 Tax=Mucilaginibacter sp. OK098 TaxID=1855297 RepID=UPI00091CF528|nr:DUF6263 family protein [Mucilaginibacter sp. OK098]SHN08474.1 hypothetical protein SAMN05216524_105103 [Mucilaginibacter sp. OK098]